MNELQLMPDYGSFLADVKNQIKSAQLKAHNAVNREMIMLYFNIGAMIHQKQIELGLGAKVIDKLSLDIVGEFPEIAGFSTRNIKRILRFYKEHVEDFEIVPLPVAQNERIQNTQQLVTQIPWTNNTILIEKINLLTRSIL